MNPVSSEVRFHIVTGMDSRPTLRLRTKLSGETLIVSPDSSSSWSSGCSSASTLESQKDSRLLLQSILEGRIRNRDDIIRLGVSWPVQPWVRDEAIHTILQQPVQCWYKERDAILVLLQSGEDAVGVDRLGDTALHTMASIPGQGSAAFMSLLLDQKYAAFCQETCALYRSSINAQNFFGNTALVVGALYNQPHCVRLLLEMGADPGIRGEFDKTALDFAQERGYVEVTYLLLQHEA